jgi:hypothetical protein
MKTNPMSSLVRLVVLGLLVVGFHAKPANAQTLSGKFTLSSATRWAQVTLSPGDYSFKMDAMSPGYKFTVCRGGQHVALIVARAYNYTSSARSEFVVENGTVRGFTLAPMGMTFLYPAKNPGGRGVPQESRAAQIIPIAAVSMGR